MTIAVTQDQEQAIRHYLNYGSLPVTSDDSDKEPSPWLKDLSGRTKISVMEHRILMDSMFILLPEEQASQVLDEVVLALRKATRLSVSRYAALCDFHEVVTSDD